MDSGQGAANTTGPYGVQAIRDPGLDATIDVLYIHGLNGHAYESWTDHSAKGKPVFWPRDLLPNWLPSARILTYGYDGATKDARPLSHQSIADIALDFVVRFSLYRRSSSTEHRPIIFIAHSVGGIVLKQALVISYLANSNHNEAYSTLHRSTYGTVFMGTPHQGTETTPWKVMLPYILSVFSETRTRNLEDLGQDSDFLHTLASHYTYLAHNFRTVFVYETLPSHVSGGQEVLLVPKGSAVVPGQANADVLARNTNHIGLAKFSSADDDDLQILVLILLGMSKDAPVIVASRWEQHNGSRATAESLIFLLSWLFSLLEKSEIESSKSLENQDQPSMSRSSIPSPHSKHDTRPLCKPANHCEIFTWHLIQLRMGYPLWDPSPPEDLPEEYCAAGADIGDIGRLLGDGTFDFLFNVCKSATDPVNRDRVPSNFVPFPCSTGDVLRRSKYHPRRSQYVSNQALIRQAPFELGGGLAQPGHIAFHYTSTAEEGAVMVLPDGASRLELRSLAKMLEYAENNAKSWFKLTTDRGMEVTNLFLVTGCDKSSTWGVASFQGDRSARESGFNFSGSAIPGNILEYDWVCNYPVVGRSSGDNTLRNQCVLLRGFNISKRAHIKQREAHYDVSILDGANSEISYREIADLRQLSFRSPNTLQANIPITSPSSYGTTSANAQEEDFNVYGFGLIPNVHHPGQILNQYLMDKYDAELVITHDNDWCALESEQLLWILNCQEEHIKAMLNSQYALNLGSTTRSTDVISLRTSLVGDVKNDSVYDGSPGNVIDYGLDEWYHTDTQHSTPNGQAFASSLKQHHRDTMKTVSTMLKTTQGGCTPLVGIVNGLSLALMTTDARRATHLTREEAIQPQSIQDFTLNVLLRSITHSVHGVRQNWESNRVQAVPDQIVQELVQTFNTLGGGTLKLDGNDDDSLSKPLPTVGDELVSSLRDLDRSLGKFHEILHSVEQPTWPPALAAESSRHKEKMTINAQNYDSISKDVDMSVYDVPPTVKASFESILDICPTECPTYSDIIDAKERDARLDTPIFVCILSLPGMSTILYIFEPRYQLMLRRCMEAGPNRARFGMVMPPRPSSTATAEYGTMLDIRSVQPLNDGRSIVTAWGTFRFRILERGSLDGYMVARIERVDDILDVMEEEQSHGSPAHDRDMKDDTQSAPPSPSSTASVSRPRSSTPTLPRQVSGRSQRKQLTVDDLLAHCLDFLNMLQNNAPWASQRLGNAHGYGVYGPYAKYFTKDAKGDLSLPLISPGEGSSSGTSEEDKVEFDLAHFSFWVGAVIPIDDWEKAKLLPVRSSTMRLQMCVSWIESLRGQWWFSNGCIIL